MICGAKFRPDGIIVLTHHAGRVEPWTCRARRGGSRRSFGGADSRRRDRIGSTDRVGVRAAVGTLPRSNVLDRSIGK